MLPFFNRPVDADKPAVYWQGEVYLTYRQLIAEIEAWVDRFESDSRKLIVLYVKQHPDSIALLIACLASRHVVLLATDGLPEERRDNLEEFYQPQLIISFDDNYAVNDTGSAPCDMHNDLCLLLSTSGSTGTPRSVRLTADNLLSNAAAIASVLDIKKTDNALVHLDLSYSYGLSVVTSHLYAGAALSVTADKFIDKKFWQAVKDNAVTHFPGVPYHYETMCRLNLDKLPLEGVRSFTQAGGRLPEKFRNRVRSYNQSSDSKLYVMYGQTEAAPRMSTLQPEHSELHEDSVGLALPGGEFVIVDENKNALSVGEEGEIIYRGPNVMLGYASSKDDLNNDDELGGELHTGDTGYLDDKGFLTVTGRGARMGKLYGWRINLDEVEKELQSTMSAFVVQHENNLHVAFQEADDKTLDDALNMMVSKFSLPVSAFKFIKLKTIPVTNRNKTDYKALLGMISEQAQK